YRVSRNRQRRSLPLSSSAMEANDLKPALHHRVQTVCLMILAFVAMGAALYMLRPMLVPFVLALLLAYLLTPVIDWLRQRLRLPHLLAVTLTFVFGLVLLG